MGGCRGAPCSRPVYPAPGTAVLYSVQGKSATGTTIVTQQKLYSDTDERFGNLMQIAYFISQKNQVTFNLRGERVTGVALSINEIIKKNNDFEDFIYHMKEMLKVITIQEKTVEQEI